MVDNSGCDPRVGYDNGGERANYGGGGVMTDDNDGKGKELIMVGLRIGRVM